MRWAGRFTYGKPFPNAMKYHPNAPLRQQGPLGAILAWIWPVFLIFTLLLPVQNTKAAASEMICARLTNRTSTYFGVTTRIFEVGVLKANGTFTPYPEFGMTWKLFVGTAKDAKYKVGGYYNQAPLALADIPKWKPYYGNNFTLTRIWEEYDEAGNRDPLFDYYEITLGGPGGVRREDGSEVISPQLATGKQQVQIPSSSSGGSLNLADNADVMAPTRYAGRNLPPGFSLSPDGVLTYPGSPSGGVWDIEIQMSNAYGSAVNRVLVKSLIEKQWTIWGIGSARGGSGSANVAFRVENPGGLTSGAIDGLELDFHAYFPGRPIAGSLPSVFISNAQVTKAHEGTFWGSDPLSIQHFNGRHPSSIFGDWSGYLSGITQSEPWSQYFTTMVNITLNLMPPPPNDAAAPTLAGQLPKTRKLQTTDSSIRISGTALDDTALSHVSYQVQRQFKMNQVQNTEGRCSGRHNWSVTADLHQGMNKIIVTAVDYAGKTSRPEIWEVTRLVETDFSVSVNGQGDVSKPYFGKTRQYVGSVVNLKAKPKPGHVFRAWATKDGNVVSWLPAIPWTISDTAFDNTLVAVFIPNPYPQLAGTYHGLLWDTETTPCIVGQPSVTVTANGSISASVAYDGQKLKVSGPLDGSGSLYKMVKHQGRSVGVWVKGNPNGSQLWVQRHNGASNGADEVAKARTLAVDGSNNVIVLGSSWNGANMDYAVVKYSPDGARLWEQRYNGTGNGDDIARAIAVDKNGHVIITGKSSNGSNDDYVTIKYAPDGTRLWVQRYNGPANGSEWVNGLAVDGGGNVIVAGGSWNGSNDDYATVKYTASGSLAWVQRYHGSNPNSAVATALAVDAGGNVIVTGSSRTSSGTPCYDTVKYAPNGQQQWVKSYINAAWTMSSPWALKVDGGNNVIVTGWSNNDLGEQVYATVKYAPDGTQLWTQRYTGGNNGNSAYAMAVDRNNNVIVTGGSFNDSGVLEYATVKYAPDGTQLWVQRYGMKNDESSARAIAVDKDGNVIVTGSSGGDSVTLKYTPDGRQQGVQRRYNGPTGGLDGAWGVEVDGNGNIIVAGESWNGTNYDYVTVKYSPEFSFGGHVDDPARSRPVTMDMQRLMYSAKNPVPIGAQGRFNLAAENAAFEQKAAHTFASLEVKPSGQMLYVANSAWGEKLMGSTFLGDTGRADIYAFIKGKTPAVSRSFAGQAAPVSGSNALMAMQVQSAMMVANPQIGPYLASTGLIETDLIGQRYMPLPAPYLFQTATVPQTLDLYYSLEAASSAVGSTWGVSSKGGIRPLNPDNKDKLTLDRKTGLWTGSVQIFPNVKASVIALTCGTQAIGSWTLPNGTITPLKTDTGAIWIEEPVH